MCTEPTANRMPHEASCRTTRPPGNGAASCDPDAGCTAPCHADADCDGGVNGRCFMNVVTLTTGCTYDDCFTNADCAAGQTCMCNDPVTGANGCVQSNCRVDADCAGGCGCSPSYDMSCGTSLSYTGVFCHAPSDDCFNDVDCGAPPAFCGFSKDANKWVCGHAFCSG
jgi:hypothetical protein